MKGISRYEKIILALAAGFLLFIGGYYLCAHSNSQSYSVTAETPVPSAEQRVVQSTQDRTHPDSLLADEVLDLNTAPAKELERLPGIGAVRAQAIVDYRTEHGLFSSLEELEAVKGIGPATLEGIRPYVSINSTQHTDPS